MISSISGNSFHFPFPYFLIYLLLLLTCPEELLHCNRYNQIQKGTHWHLETHFSEIKHKLLRTLTEKFQITIYAALPLSKYINKKEREQHLPGYCQ